MFKENNTKSSILYLVNQLKDKIEGRKKIMKLMFLVEHFNPENNVLKKENFLGNNFIVYHYGVFSFDVMDGFIELIKEEKLEDSYPIKLKSGIESSELPANIREKVDKIIQKFGSKNGQQLERETLEMLHIGKSEKDKFFGKSVKDFIN